MLLKECVGTEINVSIWFHWINNKTSSSLIEDKRKGAEGLYSLEPRHIPLVSLLLWHKMVSLCCFVWPLSLRLWSVSNGGSRMGHLGQTPPLPPFKKLHTKLRYSNRAVNCSNKAVTMFMRQCSLLMKL